MKNTPGWVKAAAALIVLAGVVFFLSLISNLVKVFVLAALLAYILDPAATYLESKGMSRAMAAAAIFVSLILIFALSLYVFLPSVINELAGLQSGDFMARVTHLTNRVDSLVQDKFAFAGGGDFRLMEKLSGFTAGVTGRLFEYFLDLANLLYHIVLVPFVCFFLLKDGRAMKKKLVEMSPNRHFEFVLNLIYKMDVQLGSFMRGQILDIIIIAIISTIALWALGVKYFYIIGAFAGIANIIPYFGPIAGGGVAAIVSIVDTGDPLTVLYIAIAFVAIKLIDDAIVLPMVMARMVHLHPLVVLFSVIIGGTFFGVFGMVLSVPAVAVIKVAAAETVKNYREYYV